MSDTTDILKLSFLPYLRRGMARHAQVSDGDVRAAVSVRLEYAASGGQRGSRPVPYKSSLLGPGEIVGLDKDQIARIWPADGADAAEPNYLPYVDFVAPDFPWRYTPETAARNRLSPWLALVALKEEEIALEMDASSSRPLPSVQIETGTLLPDLTQRWAWAHVQGLGVTDWKRALAEGSSAIVARLLCPRRLEVSTRYRVVLVPAYERGRLAGLGQDPGDTTATVAAWTGTTSPGAPLLLELPIYHAWSFTTGEAEDFESLVRMLAPGDIVADGRRRDRFGTRALYVDIGAREGPGIQRVQGALREDGAEPPRAVSRAQAYEILALDVESRTEEGDPVIDPPLYGGKHARRAGLQPAPDAGRPWIDELNTDLGLRAVAGMGAEIVRRHQEEFMAEAWEQVAEIRKDNERARLRQLGQLSASGAWKKHIQASASRWLGTRYAPLVKRLRAESPQEAEEIEKGLTGGSAPRGASDPQLRRLLRPVGALSRRRGRGKVPATTATTAATRAESASATGLLPDSAFVDPRPTLPEELIALATNRVARLLGGRFELKLERTMKAPVIRTPLIRKLSALDADWVLPGWREVAQNRVALLEPNQRFVEALLLGANHEMMRELLWREYPTDERGTVFHHFWDLIEEDGDGDIQEIAGWRARLGRHVLSTSHMEDAAILLLRGRLLLKYPETVVYAAKARWDGAAPVFDPSATPLVPILGDRLGDDLSFFAFALTVSGGLTPREVLAPETPSEANPGYFFVFVEQPAGPRFGADQPGDGPSMVNASSPLNWAALHWGRLSTSEGEYVDVSKPIRERLKRDGSDLKVYLSWTGSLRDVREGDWDLSASDSGVHAAHLARALLQQPVRFRVHASALLHPHSES